MHRIRTVILLGLILWVLSPALGQAEIWRCPQPNGTDLFTNSVEDSATCEKYISGSELGYAHGSREADPPASGAAPVNVPPYQPQVPEPYPQAGYAQEPYPYYYPYPCYSPSYDNPYYYSCPGVYGLFVRPRFFHFHRRSPFQPHFHSAPRSGFQQGGGRMGGHGAGHGHGGGHGGGGHR
jgi:hypothetical protein